MHIPFDVYKNKIFQLKLPSNTVFSLQHDRRLECRFRVLEERAFHSHNGDVTKEDNISLQENLLSENAHDSSQISEDKCKCAHFLSIINILEFDFSHSFKQEYIKI